MCQAVKKIFTCKKNTATSRSTCITKVYVLRVYACILCIGDEDPEWCSSQYCGRGRFGCAEHLLKNLSVRRCMNGRMGVI